MRSIQIVLQQHDAYPDEENAVYQLMRPTRHRATFFCHCAGGLVIGLAFGVATRLLLKLMHRKGHKAPEQLALTLAMAYLAFYTANAQRAYSLAHHPCVSHALPGTFSA